MKRLLFFSFCLNVILLSAVGGEGMWNLLLLDSLNHKDMLEKGLRLKPEEIYSINQASLKDAVVIFGGGCTGEVISPDGLLITNHHCGYSRIQSHSTVEKNYLAEGFWAGSKTEELANPGLSVSFLVRIEDVTSKVLAGISESLNEAGRSFQVAVRISAIEKEATEGTHYDAEVKSFYFGREYYLFVYEVFEDVRLVGAPPEAIGRFGGDTDNWVWPRHTGDFSLFRIYADKENKPAPYSPDNVPYKPRKYLNIDANGVKEGDFTMVLGYPGRTDEYLTSDALRIITMKALPAKIEMRSLRLKALEEEMARGPAERLRYTGRYVGTSNAWKKWIGVVKGVEHADALKKKKDLEDGFDTWADRLAADPAGYSTLMDEFRKLYDQYEPFYVTQDLGGEFLNSVEAFSFISRVQTEFYSLHDSSEQDKKEALQKMRQKGLDFFRSGALTIDRHILPSLLDIYAGSTTPLYHPGCFDEVRSGFGGNYKAYVESVFNRSYFSDSIKYMKLLRRPLRVIQEKTAGDPLVKMNRDFSQTLMLQMYRKTDSLNRELNRLYRRYLSGMMVMNPSHVLYPDANFTMRLAYGKVEGYKPSDAIHYRYYSTLDGIMEKEDPGVEDYRVPSKLKEVFVSGDFGPYFFDNKVPVCFIASNHTSGGNSGSPVLNAEGNLIGINFDRNWEGTVSDYAYDPSICRNISLDIRYVLFIIDKVAGADWLLDELTILKD